MAEPPDLPRTVCEVAARHAPADGAALSLETQGRPEPALAASSEWAREVSDLEYDLGEGPAHEACRSSLPVSVPDTSAKASQKWPAFARAAAGHRVGSLFCFPLHLGRSHLGVLALYRHEPSTLSPDEYRRCLTVSDLAMSTLLVVHSGLSSTQPPPPQEENSWPDLLDSQDADRLRIHQASGMVAVLLDCGVDDALVRMRAYAFAHDMSLFDVATGILERRIELRS